MSEPSEGRGAPAERRNSTETNWRGDNVLMCAHSHRWISEVESTRCPICGTSTFKTRGEWNEQMKRDRQRLR